MRKWHSLLFAMALMATLAVIPASGWADCPQDTLLNYTGAGSVVCPCFIEGEQAGALLQAPPGHYPIEILRVGIGWGSTFGGTPQSLEQAVHVYGAGLPDPGTPISSIPGPFLTDGVINEFNFEVLPGSVLVDSGPFAVTLEFLNTNSGNLFAPSVVHDGNGCQPGKNAVYALPGGWADACPLGVTGDWIVYAIYREVNCEAGVSGDHIATNRPAVLASPQPNPFSRETVFEFVLAEPAHVSLSLYDVRGQRVVDLVDGKFSRGSHKAAWSGRRENGAPVAAGIYFATLETESGRVTQRVVLSK